MTVSKMVLDRQQSAAMVVEAGRAHSKAIIDGVVKLFGDPQLKDITPKLLTIQLSKLEQVTEAMIRADESNHLEGVQSGDAREALELAAQTLRDDLIALRTALTGVLDQRGLVGLGFEGETPLLPRELERLGRRVLDTLEKDALPQPKLKGITLDPQIWKTTLEASLAPLSAALQTYAREHKESDIALIDKQKALETFDSVFSFVANQLSSSLTVCGEHELASRVRPSRRWRGQTMAADEGEDEQPTAAEVESGGATG